jgi:hypothetical protein
MVVAAVVAVSNTPVACGGGRTVVAAMAVVEAKG